MPVRNANRNSAAGSATIKRLLPGTPGTKRLVERFGEALVCVRYRLDRHLQRRLTTVELIVDERPAKPEKSAWLRVAYNETALRQQIKQAGGEWHSERKLWRLPLKTIKAMGLESRMVSDA